MNFLGGLLAGIDRQQVVLAEPCCNILLTDVTSAVQLLQIVGQHRKPNAKASIVPECREFALLYSVYDCLLNSFRVVLDVTQLLGDVVPNFSQ